MSKTFMFETVCPYCGKTNNAMSCAGSDNPIDPEDVTIEDGDAHMCFECGEISIVDLKIQGVRMPDDEEKEALSGSPAVQQIMGAWRRWKGKTTH